MSQLVAEPVAFRCSQCFNTNCATSLEVGQSIHCKDCQAENVVPEATEDRIKLGYEFVNQFAEDADLEFQSTFPDQEMTDAEIYAEARKEARAGAGPEKLVCSRMRRFLAAAVDSFAFSILAIVGFSLSFFMFQDSIRAEQVDPMFLVVGFSMVAMFQLVQWVMTAMDGRTIGKYCLNIKVVNLQGDPPGFLQGVILRSWLIALLGMIPFFSLIDVCVIFANDAKRCIHDFIAGTFVIDAS